ncbi:hypothetical protein [Pseudomaricurvus sp. HS19]|uniref:hypothetical protein n=1 Tax=Pseudomaricurvus sp. HS19 TaxID=2692626 RepID=UPI001370FEBF|nr:hypothetical protein [Pseudomaricurvus sp. HS19]MYM64657.1 hypothetical protein [Pseudomaricurvus sp. HS19]
MEAKAVVENHEKLQLEAMTRTYRERRSVLVLMRQLNRLISAIQRHRGVSLAHLAGDGLFMEDVHQVQAQVAKRLLVLRSSVDDFEALVSTREQQNIQHGWNTVTHDWEGDALLENFEYHSFLIDQLLQLDVALGRRLEEPLQVAAGLLQQELYKEDDILPLVCRRMPEQIEQLARIRGLATHAAVVNECDGEHDKKLQYWLQCAERQNRELMQQIDTLEGNLKSNWRTLTELRNYELKLAFFLNTIKKDILHGDCRKADARQLFTLGSEIIEAYVEAVDGGITLLHVRLEDELESWLTQL